MHIEWTTIHPAMHIIENKQHNIDHHHILVSGS